LILFTICPNAFSQEAPAAVPRVTVDRQAGSAQGAVGNILPEGIPYKDFVDRLEAAFETRDTNALQNLYQTNGVSSEELNEELNRWEPMLRSNAASGVTIRFRGCIFRDFNRSNKMWKKLAERLTTHPATHLVEVPTSAGLWMLPLVQAEGRFLMVPSDKSKVMAVRREDAEDSAPNVSEPIRSETNRTSSAAGSPR
jgi:hypothetical protein